MTNEELIHEMELMFSHCLELARKKNLDYAADEDAFKNFRRNGRFGILVRMDDKLMRLYNFERKKYVEVADESVYDTACDLINYAALYYLYGNEQPDDPETTTD